MTHGTRLRAPARTAAEECAIRSQRLEQLARRERDRSTPTPRSAEDQFWADVAELVCTAEQERDDKREIEALEALDNSEARSLRAERDDLASWLDGQ